MSRLFTRSRDESGQVFVFLAVILVALVGGAALVVDAGSWFHAQRKLQTAVDAAALAGAQHLPTDQPSARTVALDYAQRNYSGIPAPAVSFPNAATIDVAGTADTPGIFAPVLNSAFKIVTVHAHAAAQVSAPSSLKDVAPIAVYKDYACIVTDPTCFGKRLTLGFDENNPFDPTKSKYGLLDLDRDGSAGAGDMKDWLENGYPDYLAIDTVFPPANGEKNGIKTQLQDAAAAHRVLLFPVYDSATVAGYHVIGWAAFVIDSVDKWAGKDHVFTGHFVTFVATDLAAGNPITDPSKDFGVHVITLTK